MESITLLCQTINRPSLQGMIWSWIGQARIPGDRLLIYGDGCKPEIPQIPGVEGIEGFECRVIGDGVHFPGFVHLDEAIKAGVDGDYLTHIDDDEMLYPGAFSILRRYLDGRRVVVFQHSYPYDPPRVGHFYNDENVMILPPGETPYKPPCSVGRVLFPNGSQRREYCSWGKKADGLFYASVLKDAQDIQILREPLVLMCVNRFNKHSPKPGGGE